jgi:hypothetical protein
MYSAAANFGMRLEVRKSAKKLGRKVDAYARPFAD